MRRIRLLFLVFSAALLAPLAFLIQRALSSVEIERQMRHEAVAERIFDEMERGLSQVLEGEDKQPFESYGTDVSPPDQRFVIGRFEIGADGRVRVLSAAPERRNEILGRVGGFWRAGEDRAGSPPPPPPQAPGTTMKLFGAKRADSSRDQREVAAADDVSAFGALRSLNKAVEERVARQRQAAEYDEYGEYEGNTEHRMKGKKERRSDEIARLGPARERFAAPERMQEMLDSSPDRFDFVPMQGRVLDDRHLMLHRTGVRDARTVRQGVLLDVTRLGDWLRELGLGRDGLAGYASVSFATPFGGAVEERAEAPGVLRYRHRFAEPFADLTAVLELRPLPGVGSVTYVYALSALLLATGSLGLAALYRMVSVAVGFAERRSNFVAAVTHELKTPLTAIRMYAEMLRDGVVPSEAKRAEYYRHITVESERLSRLINNVLEFARLEKGNRDVALTTGSLAPVVREVADLLRPHVRAEGFDLHLEIEDDVPPVLFERDAVVQVLCNLVDNAVKYAGASSPKRIDLACRRNDEQVRVAVRDHGLGVPPRHLSKVFEPFYRGEDELTRRSKGTGLGLALVRGLVERMGARVNGRNAPGGGFEVEILFGSL